jgi:hypothetical protein
MARTKKRARKSTGGKLKNDNDSVTSQDPKPIDHLLNELPEKGLEVLRLLANDPASRESVYLEVLRTTGQFHLVNELFELYQKDIQTKVKATKDIVQVVGEMLDFMPTIFDKIQSLSCYVLLATALHSAECNKETRMELVLTKMDERIAILCSQLSKIEMKENQELLGQITKYFDQECWKDFVEKGYLKQIEMRGSDTLKKKMALIK